MKTNRNISHSKTPSNLPVLVIGSALLDITLTSFSLEINSGGVAANIARCLAYLGINTTLLTCVGDDLDGTRLINDLKSTNNLELIPLIIPQAKTGMFITDTKRLFRVRNQIFDSLSCPQILKYVELKPSNYQLIVMDGNLSQNCIAGIIHQSAKNQLKIAVDVTSPARAIKFKPYLKSLDYLKLNQNEFKTLFSGSLNDVINSELSDDSILLLTKGADGSHIISKNHQHFLAADIRTPVINTMGAGDCFMAGFLASQLTFGNLVRSHTIAAACAKIALKSTSAIPPKNQFQAIHL